LSEAEGVIRLLGEHGLKRGENDLQVIMMCELPSNAVIADQFLDHFDGFSIGSNDMTQLTLGQPPASTNAPLPSSSCSRQPSPPARPAASRSASAAKAPRIAPSWPSGCWSRGSSLCR
jgi:hypothetical protein